MGESRRLVLSSSCDRPATLGGVEVMTQVQVEIWTSPDRPLLSHALMGSLTFGERRIIWSEVPM
jgi:hypothetical protein